MSLLNQLSMPQVWERFFQYKMSQEGHQFHEKRLRNFINEQRYLPVVQAITEGKPFPLPRRAVISKMSTEKKRVVYIYPEPENTVLKLLTWLLLRRYDGLFSESLFSFRPRRTAKDAVRRFLRMPGLASMWAYKADIHDYFNSIPVDKILPVLSDALTDDPELCRFLVSLLKEPYVLENGSPIIEQKGIMAGTPLASFYANLYLKDVDELFCSCSIPYARYSDDIILFAPTQTETEEYASRFRQLLSEKGLTMNPSKECFFTPEEGWVFLGFHCRGKTVDIAPVTIKKIKGKMRRKARALRRWADRKGKPGEAAAIAFIRSFNRKLLEGSGEENELTWSLWFFPVISTVHSLHVIDQYCQDCIRFLISGKHTKARYNVSYEKMKQLGYRCLVHEYYRFKAGQSVTDQVRGLNAGAKQSTAAIQ